MTATPTVALDPYLFYFAEEWFLLECVKKVGVYF